LRISTIRVVNDIISRYGLTDRVKFEKQHLNLWNEGSLIHFGSVDDPEKIKSTEWNDIWMEEATEFTYDDFVNLELRLSAPTFGHAGYRNQIHLSFNPMDEYHWIKTKLLDKRKNDIIDIHSTYLDNPYIEQDYIDTVILPKKNEDPNYWKIFGLGEWGRLDNLIYTNWDTVPELPEGDTFYGLDFGFNRPSALVRIVVDGMEATVEELLYATGLTNSKIIELMDNILPKARRDRCPIYADNAEPQRIVEINEAGCGFKCLPANKVVLDGIDTVKRFRLHLMQDSDNLIKEVRGYSYRADKDGNVYDDPIKMNDHLMDAMRYGIHTRYFDKIKNRAKVRVRFI
jgi:phage terminase large subunit